MSASHLCPRCRNVFTEAMVCATCRRGIHDEDVVHAPGPLRVRKVSLAGLPDRAGKAGRKGVTGMSLATEFHGACSHCGAPSAQPTGGRGGDVDDEHEAYIRLLSGCAGEEVAYAECGCHLVQEDDGDVALFQCPTHSGAVPS